MAREYKLQAISDDKFITAWKQTGGNVTSLSQTFGVAPYTISKRRAKIEANHGIALESTHYGRQTSRTKQYVEKFGARALLTLKDGQVVIFSDAHYWPGEKPIAHAALVRFIKANKPAIVICNGDAFDGARISRHPPTSWSKMPDVADELAYCQQMLGEIVEACPDKTKLVWCAGNHDSRFSGRLAQMAPDYVRIKGMDLKDHFPEWEMAWSAFINDDIVVKHRMRGGLHATWNNTLHSGKTIVTGHLHRSAVTPITDYNGRRYGVDAGTLSDFGPDSAKFIYGEDNPFNWGSGFAVLTIKRGKLLPPELAIVQDKICYFRGAPV